jgi:hypothetical protein
MSLEMLQALLVERILQFSRVFNLYQAEARSGDHHFDDLVPEDVETNNFEDLVMSLAHYMGHVPIPQGNNTGKILGSASLGQ